jgi:toxin-antitoxin system PIN domain toxin
MTKYSKSFLFPDLNVWVALTYSKHVHHDGATRWFTSLPEDARLCFCRFTQISFLRLLTTPAVMGDEVLSQTKAWNYYDDWLTEGAALFLEEPALVESTFRSFTHSRNSSSKDWADSYIAAFASILGLRLVTFDKGFERKLNNLLILGD